MSGVGGNQYGMQSRVAADSGAGGPSMRPRPGGDRRTVLIVGSIALLVAAVAWMISLF